MMTSSKDDLVFDIDKTRLQSMKNFDASQWEHLNDLNRDEFVKAVPAANR